MYLLSLLESSGDTICTDASALSTEAEKELVFAVLVGECCWEGSDIPLLILKVGDLSGTEQQQHHSKKQHPVSVPGTEAPTCAKWICSNLTPVSMVRL